ncbi:GNAT family N-acetyltransferase [Oceanobacillus manasiensis]|uniref:GNAT family N-acetyltransferase n=1 Tax=Oceanobacillus manasiensis TaxID=586413 RepID=UPI0005A9599E|nr:GNAT family N-acetyltransferase [Oceanobacillus manasiensis]
MHKHPLLIDFPQEITTERLLIRIPQPGDGQSVYNAIQASKPELKKWLPFAQGEQTLEETEINVRKAHIKYLECEDMRMHIFLKETDTFIGSTGLHKPNWEIRKFEIGYWLDTRYCGIGYMTEAVRGLTDFALNILEANRVEICCDELNKESRAVPERLNFNLEGILKNEDKAVDGDELRNTCIYAKTS